MTGWFVLPRIGSIALGTVLANSRGSTVITPDTPRSPVTLLPARPPRAGLFFLLGPRATSAKMLLKTLAERTNPSGRSGRSYWALSTVTESTIQ